MSLYDISLIKLDKGYGAMQKKRCLPKEGIATCPQGMSKKKNKRKEKIAPIQIKRKRNRREMVHTKEFIHHLDQGL
jgi:hypothetical protein